jgi:hypothetical protein
MVSENWQERPREVFTLFNPAFCCTILAASIVGYQSSQNSGMPLPLAYLVFPLVFHKNTRELLPLSSRTALAGWIEENPTIKICYYDHLLALKPFVGEAIVFGAHQEWLSYADGILSTKIKDSQVTTIASRIEGEVHECILKARMVGKWFSNSGTPETIMDLLGVSP